LGCTAPEITGADILVFVADGRFHIEAAMMANPDLPAFRYDPFSNRFFSEFLSLNELNQTRLNQMKKCKSAKRVGLVLGTLGRQGSVGILESLKEVLNEKGIQTFTVLISEISPERMSQFGDSVDAWVQVACPRLSIDWGESYSAPLLSSFEAFKLWGDDSDLNETNFIYPWTITQTTRVLGVTMRRGEVVGPDRQTQAGSSGTWDLVRTK
jgi:2-(3-amino-3-carboxypropyl)histidine synthase